MSLRKALLAATVLALPVTAEAQPVRGFYVGGGIGGNFMDDLDTTLSLPTGPLRGSVSFHPGFAGVISVGYGFGNGLRTEIEANYRENEVDRVSGFGSANSAIRSSGKRFSWGVMLNALYDLPVEWPVVPYFGVGLGVLTSNFDNVRQSSRANPGDFIHLVGSTNSFAYQAIAGVSLPLREVSPGLAMTLEYRALGMLEDDYEGFRYFANGSPRERGTFDAGTNLNHSILLGVRYNFGQTTPPPVVAPAPAAAPAPARTFLVFFDWNRADLTDRARQIIGEAANNSRTTGTTRIEVSGRWCGSCWPPRR